MDFYEYIEDYCEEKLDDATKATFEHAMSTDKHLADLVAQYPLGKKVSEGLLEMDMIQVLDKLKENNTIKKSTKRKSMWAYGVAAAVLVGLAIGVWMMPSDDIDKQDYFAQNYIRPIDEDATRSVDTIGMNDFQKGKYFFALNDFEQSEVHFLMLINSNSSKKIKSEAYYWIGHTYMNASKWDEAIAAFHKTSKDTKKELTLCQKMKE